MELLHAPCSHLMLASRLAATSATCSYTPLPYLTYSGLPYAQYGSRASAAWTSAEGGKAAPPAPNTAYREGGVLQLSRMRSSRRMQLATVRSAWGALRRVLADSLGFALSF